MTATTTSRLRWALSFALVLAFPASGWPDQAEVRREVHFPDLPGYKTLVCDFHMHTVFSDGEVWPTVRVEEAWRQGLDAMAITDHIEYQPHKDDVPTKHNRSYELAEGAAREHNLLLARGAEITRDTPPGHFNALFLGDLRPLDTPEFLEVIKRANQQGAFVFWNHQAWQGEEKGRWLDVHTTMYQHHWLHGMEVANGDDYYPSAHKWCLEKKLTMLGDSDIHEPDLRRESSSRGHRTMTLVLAKERSLAGVKEALQAGRTVVWFKDRLIGREELLRPFFAGCIQVGKPHLRTKSELVMEVRNQCQTDITLQPAGRARKKPVVLPAQATILLAIPVSGAIRPTAVQYTATNFLVAPGKGLPVALAIPAP
jgi:hypothetical protein